MSPRRSPAPRRLSISETRRLQEKLRILGVYNAGATGVVGPFTRQGLNTIAAAEKLPKVTVGAHPQPELMRRVDLRITRRMVDDLAAMGLRAPREIRPIDPKSTVFSSGDLTALRGIAREHGLVAPANGALENVSTPLLSTVARRGDAARRGFDRGLDLNLDYGAVGPEVALLEDYLQTVGIPVVRQGADPHPSQHRYDDALAKAVEAYAARAGLPTDPLWGGRNTSGIVDALVKEAMALKDVQTALHEPVGAMVENLLLGDAELLGTLYQRSAQIESLPADQIDAKVAALKQGFEDLALAIDKRIPGLEPAVQLKVQNEWADLKKKLADALYGQTPGATVGIAADLWSELRERVDDAMSQRLAPLFDALPLDTIRTVLATERDIRKLPTEADRLAALQTAYATVLKPRLADSNLELAGKSPAEVVRIRIARDRFLARAEQAIGSGTAITMGRLAHGAFVRHLHELVERDRDRTLTPAARKRLEALELELDAMSVVEPDTGPDGGKEWIDDAVLRKVAPGLSAEQRKAYLKRLNKDIDVLLDPKNNDGKQFTARERANVIAYFVANTAHESMGFRTFKELGGPRYYRKRYGRRRDLGVMMPYQAVNAAGQGSIQLTGYPNKRKYFIKTGRPEIAQLLDNRNLSNDAEIRKALAPLEDPNKEAFDTAPYFIFNAPGHPNLNTYASQGDWRAYCRAVNGKYPANGQPDRDHRRLMVMSALT